MILTDKSTSMLMWRSLHVFPGSIVYRTCALSPRVLSAVGICEVSASSLWRKVKVAEC